MYGKVYSQIFDGTLHGHLEATAVFMAMIALADSEGVVDLTLTALTSRTGWPLEFIEKGIRELEEADPHSRTPTEDGRRIIRLRDNTTWGWRITNYLKYREIKDENSRREYMREYMRNRRSKQPVNNVSSSKPQLAYAEAEAEEELRPPLVPPSASPTGGKPEVPRETKPRHPRSRRCPEDFAITSELRVIARELPDDFDLDGETAKFRDHEFRDARSDWPATWRKWMRTARDSKRYARKAVSRWE